MILTFVPGASVARYAVESWSYVAFGYGSKPMKLRATPMPIATPTPVLPTAIDAATAPTIALIVEVLSAPTSTLATFFAAVPTVLPSIDAVVRERITFVDSDAPPATPTLVPMPSATAGAA